MYGVCVCVCVCIELLSRTLDAVRKFMNVSICHRPELSTVFACLHCYNVTMLVCVCMLVCSTVHCIAIAIAIRISWQRESFTSTVHCLHLWWLHTLIFAVARNYISNHCIMAWPLVCVQEFFSIIIYNEFHIYNGTNVCDDAMRHKLFASVLIVCVPNITEVM